MKRNGFLFLSILLLLTSCKCICNKGDEILIPIPNNVSDDFRHIVSGMELIPLDESNDNLLGNEIELIKCDTSFIAIDKVNHKICRFSEAGKFLNNIGRYGNGPGEFLYLTNVQIYDQKVIAFSYPSTILEYTLSGDFISSREVERLGFNSYMTSDGLLSYIGYSGNNKNRLSLTSFAIDNKIEYYLPYENRLMELSNGNEIFSLGSDSSVYVIDSYSNIVYSFKNSTVEPFMAFDFGQYSIDKRFYKASDPYVGADYIINGSYGFVHRVLVSEKIKIFNFLLRKEKGAQEKFVYGLSHKGDWLWFEFLPGSKSPCCPFRFFDGDVLYGVIAPEHVGEVLESYAPLIKNSSEIDHTLINDTHVIAKFYLN